MQLDGGTNWGNLGHSGKLGSYIVLSFKLSHLDPARDFYFICRYLQTRYCCQCYINLLSLLTKLGGYTSYDYGSAITENRELIREKYSELKLEGNFAKVSPGLLTASVGTSVTGVYSNNSLIYTTPLWGNGTATNFYIVRHSDFQTLTSATYKLSLNTSQGLISIPQLGGSLTLSGRDSKWHVTDYNIGASTLLYSTAEIFTWKQFTGYSSLVVYGGPGELHELAVISTKKATVLEGSVTTKTTNSSTILNWQTSSTRSVVQIGDLFVYVLDRNTAYNYWVPDFVRDDKWGAYTSPINTTTSVIVEAGYLVRTVSVSGSTLQIEGDLNATVPLKVIGAPKGTSKLQFNGANVNFTTNSVTGELSSTLKYSAPTLNLPDLGSLSWKYLDNLPEIKPGYSDALWTPADLTTSNNPTTLKTPVSLYGSDYGYNTGVLIFRGHFKALGNESSFYLSTQGGSAYGSSVWLNSTYIGSWPGIDAAEANNSTYTLPNLSAGSSYVFTIAIDNNGLDENWVVGPDEMKDPRGILDYSLSSHAQSDITWKLTGNLGGEHYADQVRGPLNEGGLYAERQGFAQPSPPSQSWASGNPETGISEAGIAFYSTSFELDLPKGYDVPLSFVFGNTTMDGATADYRAQLWVNGYQFGKYANNIGPQSSFPVPQGMLLSYHSSFNL